MASEYRPGASLDAGKPNLPALSLTTETVAVEPSRLALTTTPSIGPSAAELTCPVNAIGICACAETSVKPTAIAPAAKASKRLRECMSVSSIVGRSLRANLIVRKPSPAGSALQEVARRNQFVSDLSRDTDVAAFGKAVALAP